MTTAHLRYESTTDEVVAYLPASAGQGYADLVRFSATEITPSLLDHIRDDQRDAPPPRVFDVTEFGAKGNGTSDDTAAIRSAFNAWEAQGGTGGPVYFPAGAYRVTSPITVNDVDSNRSGRGGGLTLYGDNMYRSVIVSEVDGYTFTGRAEALRVHDLSVKTTTGGGFKLTEGGSVSFERFFMDGCGSAYYAVHATVPYPLTIDQCRFWHNGDGYKGGGFYVTGGHTINVRSTFVSHNQKDGDVNVLHNCYNLAIQSLVVESVSESGAAFTDQTYLALTGNNQGGYIDGLYAEGQWNTVLSLATGNSARGVRIGSVYAWQKDTHGLADPDCIVVKTTDNWLATPLPVDSVIFEGQTADAPSGDGYLLSDPSGSVSLRSFLNTSTGNQGDRLWDAP